MSPRSSRRRRYGGALATAATVIVISGGVAVGVRNEKRPTPPPTGAVTANVWVDSSGGSCANHDPPIAYTATADTGACSTFQLACTAATGGSDTVGIRPGTYAASIARFITSDCSDGVGVPVDWNASPYAELSRATGWVTFKCDGPRDSVKSSLGGFTVKGNGHVIFDGGPNRCFYWQGTTFFGEGGDSTISTQNFAFYRNHFEGGTRNWGAQNILLLDNEIGPSMKCGKANDPLVDDRIECDPDSPYEWESKWANNGTATSACGGYLVLGTSTACGGNSPIIAEPIWGINSGGFGPVGGRMEANWIHDQYVKDVVKWHPGCLLYFNTPNNAPANSFVFTRNTCERIPVQGVQIGEGGDGATISNNFFGAPLYPATDPAAGGSYTVEAPNAYTVKFKTQYPCPTGTCYWSPKNMSISYNTMAGGGHIPWTSPANPITFTNMKFIGNVTFSSSAPSTCSATGASGGEAISYVGNYGPGCTTISGTVASNLVAPGPGTDLCDGADAGCRKLDLHLSVGGKAWEDIIAVAAGGLDESVDFDDSVRSNPRTAGADER